MRKRLKNKKRSCSMCKPHKMGHCDKRSINQVKRDIADKQETGIDF